MRRALWPDDSAAQHRADVARYFRERRRRRPLTVLIAESAAGARVGFAEVSIRGYAEDCRTDRVGFLEGWWVAPAMRRRGVGRLLVEAAERWARRRGCTEFASDTRPGNTLSIAAHRALGFSDAGSVVCFRKDLERRTRASR
jgi:aminoglycoside 6'-N-acetyltransferase I